MKNLIAVFAILALFAAPVMASDPGTLYQLEGDATYDGPSGIDASGQGPSTNPDSTNWIWQTGGGSWSGVYAGSEGWLTVSESGDSRIKVEADIEMFYSETFSDNEIYFHIGNFTTATAANLTAYVKGNFTSNNGMYIGICFDGTTKIEDDMEKDGAGNYTGKILNGMQSDRSVLGSQDVSMDIEFLFSWGEGWRVPDNYGDGADHTITDTLWWLVDGGAPGSYNVQWRVRLLPSTYQPDGDYYLDPAVVAAPLL